MPYPAEQISRRRSTKERRHPAALNRDIRTLVSLYTVLMRGNRIAATLLEILVCPVCHGKLDPGASNEQDPQAAPQWLRCRGCGRRYPIEDGIPVMLESRAIGAC